MSKTLTTPSNDLRAVIAEALHAYELARAAHGKSTAIGSAEQERSSHLLASIQQVEEIARDLLEKAGLAYIAGAPLSLDGVAAPVRRTDESVAGAFAAAQLATRELRANLLQLARAFTDAHRWQEAQRVLQPLLSDRNSAWYADAHDLLCETYYSPAVGALDAKDWVNARQGFETVLKENTTYQDAANLLRESYLRPARLTLREKQFDQASDLVDVWFNQHKEDTEAHDLLCKIYTERLTSVIETSDRSSFHHTLEHLRQLKPPCTSISAILKNYPFLVWYFGKVYAQKDTFNREDQKWLHKLNIGRCAYSPDGRLLASASKEDIEIKNVASGRDLLTLRGQHSSGNVNFVAFSPIGRLLASKTWNGPVTLSDTSSGQVLHTLYGHSKVQCFAFSPDGRVLASGGQDNKDNKWEKDNNVKLWEVASGRPLHTLQGDSSEIYIVSFSPNGQLLASVSTDKTVKLWDIASGRLLHTLQGHLGSIYSVAFSPNGQLLASGGEDNNVKLWEITSGRDLFTLRGHSNQVNSVAFSSDERLLASSDGNPVKLWEVASGRLLHTLQGCFITDRFTAFSPDGRLLASGSQDNTVKLWEINSGQVLNTLQGHTDTVKSLAFSPDGKLLGSMSEKETLVWEPRLEEMETR